jgi:hypothetical protein
VKVLASVRKIARSITERHRPDQQLEVPTPFANNLLWNYGHIIVVQQLFHYARAGLDLHIPDSLVAQCRPGTSPADWQTPPDIAMLHHLAVSLPEQLEQDLAAGLFTSYDPYTTRTGLTLSTIDDAIAFNLFHEGLHVGVMSAIAKHLTE